MPGNLIHFRRRVRSVKNIQQITRAMKLVAASKLKRAQDRIVAARPYANRMLSVLNSMARRIDPSQHPLLAQREGERVMLVVITGDRGLCGSFNSNIIRSAMNFIENEAANRTLSLTLVGRRGVEWFKTRPWPVRHEFLNIMTRVDHRYAREIGKGIIDYFSSSELGRRLPGVQRVQVRGAAECDPGASAAHPAP